MKKYIAALFAIASLLHGGVKFTGTELYDQVAHHEGKRYAMYIDSVGVPTIGVGFNLNEPHNIAFLEEVGLSRRDILNGRRISEGMVVRLYNHSIRQAYQDAIKYMPEFKELPEEVQLVLMDMSFNLGSRLHLFTDMKKEIQKRNWKGMVREMIDSKWYTQVGRRGENLVAMMEGIL